MFNNMLESRKGGTGSKKWWTLPVAFVVHMGAIGFAVAATYVVVEAVQDPDLMITFVNMGAPPPPPPPPPPPAAKPAATQQVVQKVIESKPINPNEMAQPTDVKKITKEDLNRQVEEDAGGGGVEGGVEGGVPGGVPGGVIGGVIGGTIGGVIGGDVENKEPIIVAGDVKPPVPISQPNPDYPEAARRARIEGKVILQAIINEQGAVEGVKVLRSNPLLDDAAMAAVRRWRYKPATLDGQPVKVYFTVVVTFKLE